MATMARVTDQDVVKSHVEVEERIRQRAYEIYQARGGAPGAELDDWLEAESEILGGGSEAVAQSRATTVGSAKRPDHEIEEWGEA